MRRLSDRQRLSWLRLIRTPNVGPASFKGLIQRFGSADAAIEMLPELMISGGARRLSHIPSVAEAEAEMEIADRFGARFVAVGEADYPLLVAKIDNPPPLLALKGDANVFNRPTIAIVGARNASVAGIRFARRLAAEVGAQGWVIASGLARGIDKAAHEGALASGTVAVLAGGLDRPYPPENVDLLNRIVDGAGAAITEMPFGHEPRAQDFPRRNRIVAALSYGLVVVEAAERSGSLISARMASEIGRTVFAVPGSPLDPRSAGANGLIKNGATLVTNASDILQQLAPLTGGAPVLPPALAEPIDFSDAPPRRETDIDRIIEALGPTPIHVDDIARHTELHPATISMALLELELAGKLERHPGGSVSLLFGLG